MIRGERVYITLLRLCLSFEIRPTFHQHLAFCFLFLLVVLLLLALASRKESPYPSYNHVLLQKPRCYHRTRRFARHQRRQSSSSSSSSSQRIFIRRRSHDQGGTGQCRRRQRLQQHNLWRWRWILFHRHRLLTLPSRQQRQLHCSLRTVCFAFFCILST